MEEQQNSDYKTLAGILLGIGFLLILISFGARRKKKGGAKRTEKKQQPPSLRNDSKIIGNHPNMVREHSFSMQKKVICF